MGFDCRNDTDALWHQFSCMPQRIFDIQVADVLCRRNRGLTVKYVISLTKAIGQYNDSIGEAEAKFAKEISDKGKALYDPSMGGKFEIFAERPLPSTLLIYSAFDSRHLLRIFDVMREKLDGYSRRCEASWANSSSSGMAGAAPPPKDMVSRVFEESQKRAAGALCDRYAPPKSR